MVLQNFEIGKLDNFESREVYLGNSSKSYKLPVSNNQF